jgi:(2R)-3-sulfolactate dehydrogenase (NADP+)
MLIQAMLADEGVRLPGMRRTTAAAKACAAGIEVPEPAYRELRALAG